ncbi:DNA-3-methyladenine glycosylase I [Candidatus Enterococcus mangumiae]|uniref:DNA-3-methyladenine glycosylase I n=1 Tax=Candidatus Enterococcus mangumiae TaxID=2230878 RepID=A0ABZ2T0M1_9ENTE|nr:DNA-3-methyladenine glycosylase I [Enterococcus sp. DIV1094]MBO0489960.1 DNA-3-methyladenine glycosylase I [Enterococcus sp. DIV1094]
MKRCPWSESTENMRTYHDTVWGVPEYDDQKLYRKLMLDINQAGLSWQTILNKSDAFDEAYDQFDLEKVAKYDDNKIEELLDNKGIIRNRRKIEAAITNARAVLAMQATGQSFSDYLWSFVDGEVVTGNYKDQSEVPTTSELSDRIAKDLKKRGFKFIGSTTIYAFLEAVGIINDHLVTCFRHGEVKP